MYNWGTGSACYGGPGGGYINIVNNYYKAGPGTKNKTTVTQVTVATSGNADKKHPELYGYSSRYFIIGNYVTAASSPDNYDWKGVKYDGGLLSKDNEKYIKDAAHLFGDKVEYTNIGTVDCVRLNLDSQIDPGIVTTHKATVAYAKLLENCGASLYRDAADIRYAEEARTGTVTFNGDVAYVDKNGKVYATSNTKGILDFINDPAGEENPKTASFPTLPSNVRPDGFDSDGDGIPDAWETANGLNPDDASDGKLFTLDSKGWYDNFEVYLSSLVEHIMKAGNADAISSVDEYYPAYTAPTSAIEEITVSGEVERIEYYNLQGIRLAEPVQGINIRRTVYRNGDVVTDKVLK